MFNDLFWSLYWIDVLSNIPGYTLIGGLSVGLLALAVGMVVNGILDDEYQGIKAGIWFFCIIYPIVVLFSFIPSKQTMYMMLGVKTTDNVVNSETGQKLQKIINSEIDNYLKKFEKSK